MTTETVKLPYWVRGDTNAFFGFGVILPALGIALVAGNIYYTYLARRLAAKENRSDVTAMPYGPSVPHMFIVIFVIMLPKIGRAHV